MRKLVFALCLLMALSITAGAPLKGVDVKLGRNPGGTMRTVTTGPNGEVKLGKLEAGTYTITLGDGSVREAVDVQIDGLARGTNITFSTDGSHPVNVTIVKSKSNISNN